MINRQLWLTTALVLASGLMAQGASVSCARNSFANYAASEGLCSVGDIGVFNFELFTLDTFNSPTPADYGLLSTIMITPTWNSTTGAATILINGFTDFAVDAAHTAAWRVHFSVDPPPIIRGDDVGLDPPFGAVFGYQTMCPEVPAFCEVPAYQTFGLTTNAHFSFDPPVAALDLFTTVRLNPNQDTASGFDGLVFTIDTAPEPATWFALAPLTWVLWRNRRRSRKI